MFLIAFDITISGLSSTEIMSHCTLTVMIVNFSVGLCFIFYKYESATKEKRPTIIKSLIAPLFQNDHIIEMEDRVYDIIQDTDMLDDQNIQQVQIQLSPDYFSESHCNECKESKNKLYDFSFQSLSSATKRDEHQSDCSASINGDNTSSSDENYQKVFPDNLNLHQQSVEMSFPRQKSLIAHASVHTIDTSVIEEKTKAAPLTEQ